MSTTDKRFKAAQEVTELDIHTYIITYPLLETFYEDPIMCRGNRYLFVTELNWHDW